MGKYPFCIIEWVDHCTSEETSAWKNLERLREELTPCTVRSAGWVLKETKDYLVLVSHIGINDERVWDQESQGEICILKGCIIKRIRLTKYDQKE